jgi:hypothetical protein
METAGRDEEQPERPLGRVRLHSDDNEVRERIHHANHGKHEAACSYVVTGCCPLTTLKRQPDADESQEEEEGIKSQPRIAVLLEPAYGGRRRLSWLIVYAEHVASLPRGVKRAGTRCSSGWTLRPPNTGISCEARCRPMRMVTERSGVSMRPPWSEGFVSFIPLFDSPRRSVGPTAVSAGGALAAACVPDA